MKERYLLTDLGVVSALGVGVYETRSRLFAGDTSGMRELGPLSGGDKTVETLTVRLMQALKLCHTPEEIRAFMESPV